VISEAEIVVRYEIDTGGAARLSKEACVAQLVERSCRAIFKFLPRVHA
jgi:hypothetical protein